MRVRTRILGVAALLGTLHGAVQLFPELAFVDVTDLPAWLPQLSTVGSTVIAYIYASRALAFLLSPVAALAVGYWLAGQVDLHGNLGPHLGRFAGGVLAGEALGRLAVAAALPSPGSGTAVVAMALVPAVGAVVFASVAMLAGAGLRSFAGDPPTTTDPPASTAGPADGTTGD